MYFIFNRFNIITFISVVTFFAASSDSAFGQETTSSLGYKQAKKAIKHNEKVPRLTYFIHTGDSLMKLFNVSLKKESENIIFSGWTTKLDDKDLMVYEKMKKGVSSKEFSPEEKLLANQAHINTDEINVINGNVSFQLNDAKSYTLYEGAKKNGREHKWILPFAGGVGAIGIIALGLYGLSQITWF